MRKRRAHAFFAVTSGAIAPNIAAVLRGEKAPANALARELRAMRLL